LTSFPLPLGTLPQDEQDVARDDEEKYGLTSQMIAEIVGTAILVQGTELRFGIYFSVTVHSLIDISF
jgi:hypothetical protein